MKRAPDEQRRRVCKHCGGVFFSKPSKARTYCGMACKRAAKPGFMKTITCPACNSIFSTNEKKQVFCSKRCAWVVTKGPGFNAAIAKATAKARGDAQRDRGNSTGYRKLNGRHEHRVVAELMLGRPLAPGEIVHHVDGNKRNNSPGNLRVMLQRDHMIEHGLGVPGKPLEHRPWTKRAKGEALSFAKLTGATVRDIRARVSAGEPQKMVGASYGLPQSYVSQIVNRKRWRHIP